MAIALVGFAVLGAAYWALWQRRASAAGQPEAEIREVSRASQRIDGRTGQNVGAAEAGAPVHRVLVDGVPNTSIPQLPEDRPLAVLEFDGPPGRVVVRRGEVVIGRHSDDDVRVPDIRVSRHHARLVAHGGGNRFEIHNLTAVRSEPNPMLVNGRSREHASVGDGDVVTLGGVSFRLRLATG